MSDETGVPALTNQEVNVAMTQNVCRFPRIDRLQKDPPIPRQNTALFSFKLLPKPVNGVYGFIKARGAFDTDEQYIQHAKNLIKSVDSKNRIWPCPMGEWVPITDNEAYAQETLEVKEQEEVVNIFNQKESEEKREAREKVRTVAQRERQLIEESQRGEPDVDSIDYHAQRVMHLHQTELWLEQVRKKKRDLIKSATKARNDIEQVRARHPERTEEEVQARIAEMRAEIGLDEKVVLGG